MALGKDTKIIKQGVNKIIDILEGGGSGEIAEVKSVCVCMNGDNVYEPIDPITEQGVKVYKSNESYKYNQDGLIVYLLTDDDYPHQSFDNVAGMFEMQKNGYSQFGLYKNIGIVGTIIQDLKFMIPCFEKIDNPDSVKFFVLIDLARYE